MKDRAISLTLLACAVTTSLFILTRYVWNGGSPSHRLGYGIFMSITPALAAVLLLKLTKPSLSWQRTVGVYVLLFAITVVIQSFARMLPTH
jgi:uncharacterized membrane protein YjdF